MLRDPPTLDVCQRLVQQRDPGDTERVAHAIESIVLVEAGESTRERLLVG